MKKIITLFIFSILLLQVTAQQPPQGTPPQQKRGQGLKNQRIEMYKVQFISQKLKLTKEEAEAFWPIYEGNKREMQEIIKSKGGDEILLQEAMLNTKKKFKSALKPVLKSDDRVNQALKIDREFLKRVKGEMGKRNAAMDKRKKEAQKRKGQY